MQQSPNSQPLRGVEPKQRDGRASDGGQRNNGKTLEVKVFVPAMSTWVKQADDFSIFRISRRKIRAFPAVAVPAGKREIVRCGFPVVLLGNDVICFVGLVSVVFIDEAVLTTPTRSNPHGISQDR